jgi:hypothetical protein
VSPATPRKARLKFSKSISIAPFWLIDEDRKAGFYSPKGTFYWTFCDGGTVLWTIFPGPK